MQRTHSRRSTQPEMPQVPRDGPSALRRVASRDVGRNADVRGALLEGQLCGKSRPDAFAANIATTHRSKQRPSCGSAAQFPQTGRSLSAKWPISNPAVRCARVQCLRCGTKPSFAAQRHLKAGGTSALRKILKNACNRACARIRLQNLITEVTHALNGGRVWLKKR